MSNYTIPNLVNPPSNIRMYDLVCIVYLLNWSASPARYPAERDYRFNQHQFLSMQLTLS
jgi:hypothetical protein